MFAPFCLKSDDIFFPAVSHSACALQGCLGGLGVFGIQNKHKDCGVAQRGGWFLLSSWGWVHLEAHPFFSKELLGLLAIPSLLRADALWTLPVALDGQIVASKKFLSGFVGGEGLEQLRLGPAVHTHGMEGPSGDGEKRSGVLSHQL